MAAGKIILLNGSSSAGKTTIARMMQQLYREPWQHIALDQFRDGMSGRFRGLNSPPGDSGARGLNVVPVERDGEPVTEIRFGDVGRRVLRGMRRSIAAFAREGNHVIVDDLMFEESFLLDYLDVLRGLDVTFAGIRCDLKVVNVREATRPRRFPGRRHPISIRFTRTASTTWRSTQRTPLPGSARSGSCGRPNGPPTLSTRCARSSMSVDQ